MGLEDVDVECEWTVLVPVDELRGPVAQEGGLGELLGQCRRILAGEDHGALGLLVRLVAALDQEVVIVAEYRQVLVVGVVVAVLVLYAHPLVEAVLADDLVAQVPLAVVGGVVLRRQEVGDGPDRVVQANVVLQTAVDVGPQPGQDRRARRGADGRADVAVLEYEAAGGKGVEVGGLDEVVAVAGHRVGPLLVGEDEEYVGLSRHSFPHMGYSWVTVLRRIPRVVSTERLMDRV